MVRVLIADDSPIMRKIIKTNLEKVEVKNIKEAKDGAEAFNILLADDSVNLVFLDLSMPQLDGIDVVKGTREHNKHQNTRYIIISSELSDIKKDELTRLNIKDYIPKPFDLKEFEKIALPIIKEIKDQAYLALNKLSKQSIEFFFKDHPVTYVKENKIVLEFPHKIVSLDIPMLLAANAIELVDR